jgi:beta-glucosidase
MALDRSIDALIGDMTLEEKAGQLTCLPAARSRATAAAANPDQVELNETEQAEAVRKGLVGALFNGSSASWHRRMQQIAVEQSRLGIPLLFAADVIHGFETIFPVPLGEAASFDPTLAERTARTAAVEASAAGLAWNFAPMVDVARDARWGRGVEGAGEDVLVGERFAAARVRGFQGAGDLSDATAMAATPKHFVGYGACIAGLDYNSVDLSERTLRETYFPPFGAGFAAGAAATMAAFNDVAGVPAHANPWLLRTILRDEMGFDGLVVSDFTGDLELIFHGVAADDADAARLALLGGVDMSMASGLYVAHLPALVRAGAVPEAVVDAAVRRVLELKRKLGLFDDPHRRTDQPATTDRSAHRALAREAARKSVVMLHNDGILPLAAGRRIALIGPFGEGPGNLHGPWVLFADAAQAVDLASGLRAAYGDASLDVVRGCDPEAPIEGGIAAAVAAANDADLVILAVGESEAMSGEAQSRVDIGLPAEQQALAEAIAATGKPVVTVLTTGRALVLGDAVAQSNAVLVGWFLGSESGPALADILTGAHGPSGRLPISFPVATGQSPFYYDRKRSGRPPETLLDGEQFKTRYRETLNRAAFPFGHGLTYGEIVYASLTLSSDELAADGTLDIRATIENRGRREATELVQLYIHDRVASITPPLRQLKDWRHVTLAPGASCEVSFTLTPNQLRFVGTDCRWVTEPGLFDLWVGPSCEAGLSASFTLLPG